MARLTPLLRGLILVLALSGCRARLSSSENEAGSGNGAAGVHLDDLDTVDPETLPDGISYASRVPRLNYAEYDRSVSALLGMNVAPSQLFPAEQPNLGPFESGASRSVGERLLQELILAAETLAAQAVADETRYLALVSCAPTAEGCRDTFLERFGRKAYRRPLTDGELARFRALFDSGGDLLASGDAFKDGVQLVIEATLQSAKFLYRPERGAGKSDEAGPLLDDYEIATRLAFLFWGEGPDEALLDAAADGKLSTPDGLSEQVKRLAADSRLRQRLLDFHDRWFEMDGVEAAQKDATLYPSFGPSLVASMRAETQAFFDEVLVAQNGAIVDLLESRYSALDSNLATLYGVEGTFGETATPFEFPAEFGRGGLLTRGAFLTSHSSASTRTSPILRGVFVLKRLLCEHIPEPPSGAAMQEPDKPAGKEPLTTRDYFTWKTSMPACTGCHRMINPVGFAFENYDAIGQFRTTEKGAPVVATGKLDIADSILEFDNASELVKKATDLSRLRSCYSLHWLHYAYGRDETNGDSRTLARMTQGLREGSQGVREMLEILTRSAAFKHLPPTQEP